ncbi:hypothetical protein GUJ93_ZPchr0006g43963 [Zizania palustris]|uniref:Uncharacterized protein n=1 Tax=Zizania palustris TaxID=103762 RepID=A0A8J5SI90_ZIZPA|nr:hypothetical protein GUJ93_ZPchr0006g43963 [Zizania palustris]
MKGYALTPCEVGECRDVMDISSCLQPLTISFHTLVPYDLRTLKMMKKTAKNLGPLASFGSHLLQQQAVAAVAVEAMQGGPSTPKIYVAISEVLLGALVDQILFSHWPNDCEVELSVPKEVAHARQGPV